MATLGGGLRDKCISYAYFHPDVSDPLSVPVLEDHIIYYDVTVIIKHVVIYDVLLSKSFITHTCLY